MLCPSCGRDNPSDAQFCNGCGVNLDAPVVETPPPMEESGIMTSGMFLGRRREMGDLTAALEDAMAASDNPDELKMELKGIVKGTRTTDFDFNF